MLFPISDFVEFPLVFDSLLSVFSLDMGQITDPNAVMSHYTDPKTYGLEEESLEITAVLTNQLELLRDVGHPGGVPIWAS